MDEHVLERALRRIEEARADGGAAVRFEAALDRSRAEVESLARAASNLETSLPDRVGEAVREGLAREVATVARSLAEIRGLLNHAIRRLERVEQELLAEREARLDDFAVLVDLVSSGWRGVDERLGRIETSGAEIVPLRTEREAAIAS
jgi:ABC-type transporter Mla subunit MlaD